MGVFGASEEPEDVTLRAAPRHLSVLLGAGTADAACCWRLTPGWPFPGWMTLSRSCHFSVSQIPYL